MLNMGTYIGSLQHQKLGIFFPKLHFYSTSKEALRPETLYRLCTVLNP